MQARAGKPSVRRELKCFCVSEKGNSITGVLDHGALLALMKRSLGVNSILISPSLETSHLWGFKTGSEMEKTKSASKPCNYNGGNFEGHFLM